MPRRTKKQMELEKRRVALLNAMGQERMDHRARMVSLNKKLKSVNNQLKR